MMGPALSLTSTTKTLLAGEPRAIDDASVILLLYAVWQIARLGRRFGPAALSIAAGLALGACLGAIQWMPGLAVVGTSQRGASTVALFNSGSLPHRWLLLMLVPDLLGGSGSFGQPAFLANYNLAEVTGSSPHGVRVIRSVAATAGWSATWRPRRGAAATLAVRREGLVQAVEVPAGRGVLTWSYRPPGSRWVSRCP